MGTRLNRALTVAMVSAFLLSSQFAQGSRLAEETTVDTSVRRSLLQTCWPGMRLNCPSDTQVQCEVGGVGGCSCSAMQACLPEVSGCFLVVNGVATTSCGF